MKVALIFENPTTCEDCPCCIIHENANANIVSARCGAIYKGWIDERTFEKHELCPLKSLPAERDDNNGLDHYSTGWNDCLDSIAKGE